MGAVRLQDVAAHAGVSMKTVSNVVHDYAHVSAAMRERVQRSIDELGYRPNLLGRRLATGRTGLLSVAFSFIDVPYFSELARLLSEEAEKRGYRVLFEQTGGTPEGERAVIASGEAGLVDGLIFQPSVLSTQEITNSHTDVPLVLLGEIEPAADLDHVKVDNVTAAKDITLRLARSGRTRIAFAGHEIGTQSQASIDRVAGYRIALTEAGLPHDDALLIPVQRVTAQDAAAAIGAALDAGLRFDALVCRDDLAAIGALRAIGERGLAIPGDIAVTGWDDISLAAITYPSLTTVAPDVRAIARQAIDMLEERIEGFDGPGRHRIADYSIAVRESAPLNSV